MLHPVERLAVGWRSAIAWFEYVSAVLVVQPYALKAKTKEGGGVALVPMRNRT